MGWTEQQQDAISARDTSVIVSAAAGSGKTAVLTERLVQLIADPQSGVRADIHYIIIINNFFIYYGINKCKFHCSII